MSIDIMQELNPIYETMSLLYFCYDLERFKKEFIHQLTEVLGDGEAFYQKHFNHFDLYLNQFHKNRVTGDEDSFYFRDTSIDFYNSMTLLFIANDKLIDNIDQMSNDQLMELIFMYSEDVFDQKLPDFSKSALKDFMDTDNLSSFINSMELTESEKWKLFLLLQNPKEYLSYFARLIRDNIPAYEAAAKSIKVPLKKYLEQYKSMLSDEEKAQRYLEDHNLAYIGITKLIPSMANSSSIIVMQQNCYFGLCADHVFDLLNKESDGKEHLLTRLKALSDKSKFEILMSLKSSPKYATELATLMGLTSATVSHHMGTLLASQLVYVEKENGKYYYHVDTASIEELLLQLRQQLL